MKAFGLFVCFIINNTGYGLIIEHDVHVTVVNTSTTSILSFVCNASISTFSCGAEFLINDVTIEEIRYDNNQCHSSRGVCEQDTCDCNEACQNFTLNYEIAKLSHPFLFGCTLAFTNDVTSTTHRSKVTKLYNMTGIYHHEKRRYPQLSQKQNKTENPLENNDNHKSTESHGFKDFETCASWISFTIAEFLLLTCMIAVAYGLITCQKSKGSPYQTIPQTEPRYESQKKHLCNTCKMPETCAICTFCEKKYCDICCDAHTKYYPDHNVCQVQHMFTFKSEKMCKICTKRAATKICFECNKIICNSCFKEHLSKPSTSMIFTLHPHIIRTLQSIPSQDQPGIIYKDAVALPVASNVNTIRVCGLAILADGSIVVADSNYHKIQVFQNSGNFFKVRLKSEPRGIVGLPGNRIAITFGHSKEFSIYEVLDGGIKYEKSINIGANKPFAVAYNNGHFALEVNEGEDGQIFITNLDKVLKKILNVNNFAHFNGNTIRLALDMETKKIFVSSLSKKSVSCVDFDGKVLWAVTISSPRSIMFLAGKSNTSLVLASRRCSAIYRLSPTDGCDDVLLYKSEVTFPRYMAYNDETKLLCIQTGEHEMKIKTYKVDVDRFRFEKDDGSSDNTLL